MAFMEPLLVQRQGIESSIPYPSSSHKKRRTSYKKSGRVPPYDKFAKQHIFTLNDVEDTSKNLSKTVAETQQVIIKKENSKPKGSTFNMILRHVKRINKDDYSAVVCKIMEMLPRIKAENDASLESAQK
ncbi:hypothetical protein QAD02_021307 [Eretmocerus hayati]|uniref:Uncharacterized protein n=1 Tax=Eretmocerus hayati TaxID=131215 RepID=A0ACC2PQC1_9HYME|nr:hypothetical protein QAD02_021307 [Eretmocerus hayati]